MKSNIGVTGQALFAFNNSNNNQNGLLLMIRSNGSLGISDYGLWNGYTGNIVINDGNCHHIVYARNGNPANIYIDGNLQQIIKFRQMTW
jgi:hypothetical protein